MPRRRSLWRRFRRATRGPRNAFLARAIRGAMRGLGVLPVPVALALGRALGGGAHVLLGRPRRLALAHVAVAFPELDPPARRALVRATFRHAGESFAELTVWPKLRERGWVSIEGIEIMHTVLAAGRGAIAVTGHVGNWELMAAAMTAHGCPLTVVARRVNDARFDALVADFRRSLGVEVLVRDDPEFLSGVREALGRNRVVAILIDQDTRGAGVFVPFFGRPARTPAGAAVLALRARVPLCTAFVARRPEGGHLVRIATVPVPPRPGRVAVTALTATLTAAIEAGIRRAPADWVWWHERWRRQPDA
jgi:KDO2-lipid IV(A) lauroyltransferase